MAKSKTPSYVLTLPMEYTISDESALDKYFELSRKLYNALLGESLKRFNLMTQSKLYQYAKKEKDDKLKQELFKQVEEKYGFREYDMIKFATPLRVNEFGQIDSNTVQVLAKRAFNSVNKIRFGNAKRVNYISYNDGLSSIEGASNKQGIRYRDGIVHYNKLKMPVIIKANDIYAQKAIQDRVKYCRIIRRNINGKIKYYVQLILEGAPPYKYDKDTGEVKLYITHGKVGIDIGIQTVAYSSNTDVKLLELAPEINNMDREIKLLQRKMDRSKRATNPNKFNIDGTFKKGNRDKWVKSNNYTKTQNRLASIQRKQASIRKQSHSQLANEIIKLGDEFYVETMNYKGLQKRAKNTTINEKTGRVNKKKRFGKSIANKAPAMLIEIIDRKLKYFGLKIIKINTQKVKASQYNHFTNEYNKKELKDRWNIFKIEDKEIKIQRDLYSAFLIQNVEINKEVENLEKTEKSKKKNKKENENKFDSINRELCFKTYDNFKTLHDIEITRIINSDNKKISSMGL